MPKFGLRGDDAGMFDLASDDDSDDGTSRCQQTHPQFVGRSTNFSAVFFERATESIPSSFASFGKPSTGRPIGGASAAAARAALFGGEQSPGTLFEDE
jgi:cytochrome c1